MIHIVIMTLSFGPLMLFPIFRTKSLGIKSTDLFERKLNNLNPGEKEVRWRTDNKCGLFFPLSDGSPMECNPNGDTPCCSVNKCISIDVGTCNFAGNINYREVQEWSLAGKY